MIFSVLGFMALKQGVPVEDVAKSGKVHRLNLSSSKYGLEHLCLRLRGILFPKDVHRCLFFLPALQLYSHCTITCCMGFKKVTCRKKNVAPSRSLSTSLFLFRNQSGIISLKRRNCRDQWLKVLAGKF